SQPPHPPPTTLFPYTTLFRSASSKTESAKEVVSDSVITTKIKAEFANDKQVSAMSIKVDTDKGVVKLSGNAKSKDEADKAASIRSEEHTSELQSRGHLVCRLL